MRTYSSNMMTSTHIVLFNAYCLCTRKRLFICMSAHFVESTWYPSITFYHIAEPLFCIRNAFARCTMYICMGTYTAQVASGKSILHKSHYKLAVSFAHRTCTILWFIHQKSQCIVQRSTGFLNIVVERRCNVQQW